MNDRTSPKTRATIGKKKDNRRAEKRNGKKVKRIQIIEAGKEEKSHV